jgi:hypothetical protein
MATKAVHSRDSTKEKSRKVVSSKTVKGKSGATLSPKTVVDTSPRSVKSTESSSSKKRGSNEETAQVARDADAGKNLRQYADTDDLFKKLGIKVGNV